MVLHTSLLNTPQYKVRIKGKVKQSWERGNALPHTSVYYLLKREPSGRPRLRSPTCSNYNCLIGTGRTFSQNMTSEKFRIQRIFLFLNEWLGDVGVIYSNFYRTSFRERLIRCRHSIGCGLFFGKGFLNLLFIKHVYVNGSFKSPWVLLKSKCLFLRTFFRTYQPFLLYGCQCSKGFSRRSCVFSNIVFIRLNNLLIRGLVMFLVLISWGQKGILRKWYICLVHFLKNVES